MSRFIKMFLLAAMVAVGSVWADLAPTHEWDGCGSGVIDLEDGSVVEIFEGASGTLEVPDDATITIICAGDKLIFNGFESIILNIPASSKVIWQARYSSSVHYWATIQLEGEGVFEVVDGAEIRNTDWGYAILKNTTGIITVFGGVVSSYYAAIYIEDVHHSEIHIMILGGEVRGDDMAAIYLIDVNESQIYIEISGGVVSSDEIAIHLDSVYESEIHIAISGGVVGGYYYAVYSESVYECEIHLSISGGEVSSTWGAVVFEGTSDNVINATVSGGVVISGNGLQNVLVFGFSSSDDNTLVITDGLIIAQRTNITSDPLSVLGAELTGELGGTIIAYRVGTYTSGSRDGLTSLPANSAMWRLNSEGQGGIRYSDGFFYIWSVIVNRAQLTITGVSATDRAYNGFNTVVLTGGELVGVIGDDEVGFNRGNGIMANANAGDNKAVSTSFSLTGEAMYNYMLIQPTGITVNISRATPSPTTPTGLVAAADQTLADITLPAGWSWKEALTTAVGAIGNRTHVATYTPQNITNFTTLDRDLTIVVGAPSSVFRRTDTDIRFGIVLENAVVSEQARISVITPEPATVNVRILDNLGNVVFTETVAYPYGRVLNPPLHSSAVLWNLTNQSGRYVANGTYLIIVEATGISGRRFTYSTRIGVNR
ncbi:MAG: YDG domain-containing protein [Chitinivibrionia bacterium]|nr:YDG domain-containing protein [Chitinivibrionia bacterium]